MNTAPFSNLGTSLEAARDAQRTLGTKRARVLAAITSRPSTANEVAETTGLGIQTVTARIRGMVLDGTLVDTYIRRPSHPGGKLLATVWGLNSSARPAPAPNSQTVGRLAAAVSRERETWRMRMAIATTALERIESLAEIAKHSSTQPLVVQMEATKIRDTAHEALAQVKAEPEPVAVGLRRRRREGVVDMEAVVRDSIGAATRTAKALHNLNGGHATEGE